MLLKRVFAPDGSIAAITLEDMRWRVEVLLERMLAPEDSIAALAPRHSVVMDLVVVVVEILW